MYPVASMVLHFLQAYWTNDEDIFEVPCTQHQGSQGKVTKVIKDGCQDDRQHFEECGSFLTCPCGSFCLSIGLEVAILCHIKPDQMASIASQSLHVQTPVPNSYRRKKVIPTVRRKKNVCGCTSTLWSGIVVALPNRFLCHKLGQPPLSKSNVRFCLSLFSFWTFFPFYF